jgi:imidazolonepropionase-like amidohydrolase
MQAATAITNVRVFDGKQLGTPATVVLTDGLISAGPAPGTAEVIDGMGGALLPGFIDAHAHVSAEEQLRAYAAWGVTTVLDMAARNFDATTALKSRPDLPTLRTAGRPASGPGSMFIKKMGFPPSTAVSGPQDAARFIADRVADGSDYIKIIVEDPKFPGAKPLSAESIAAVVAAAHSAGLTTVAHVVSADTLRTAIASGVDIVTHTSLTRDLDGDFEGLLADRPVIIIPTLSMMQGVVHSIGGTFPMRALSVFMPSLRLNYRHAESTVATFKRAGKVILAGTDANDEKDTPFQPPHGESLHEELRRLVDAGLTPVEALQGATCLAADAFGLSDRGVITAGRRADLVLVAGDPTADIRATRNIRGVWIAGARVQAAT